MFALPNGRANIYIINTDTYFNKIFKNIRLIKTIYNNIMKISLNYQ
jgi:hypothetical protein